MAGTTRRRSERSFIDMAGASGIPAAMYRFSMASAGSCARLLDQQTMI
jgi:hypothetical protein